MKIEVKDTLRRDTYLSVLFDGFECKEEQAMPRFREISVPF